jgi:hypothetical protein
MGETKMRTKLNTWNKGILAGSLLLVLSAVAMFTVHHRAAADTQIEEKIYSNVSLEEEFSDDRILVVLNREASMDFREYTPGFP